MKRFERWLYIIPTLAMVLMVTMGLTVEGPQRFISPTWDGLLSNWGIVDLPTGVPQFNCVGCKGITPLQADTGSSDAGVPNKYVIFPNGYRGDTPPTGSSLGNGDMAFRNNNLIRWADTNGQINQKYIGSVGDNVLSLGVPASGYFGFKVADILYFYIEKVSGGGARIQFNGSTNFANLGAVSNGSMTYCADCTFASPCAGAGTGAIAKGIAGAWRCD